MVIPFSAEPFNYSILPLRAYFYTMHQNYYDALSAGCAPPFPLEQQEEEQIFDGPSLALLCELSLCEAQFVGKALHSLKWLLG